MKSTHICAGISLGVLIVTACGPTIVDPIGGGPGGAAGGSGSIEQVLPGAAGSHILPTIAGAAGRASEGGTNGGGDSTDTGPAEISGGAIGTGGSSGALTASAGFSGAGGPPVIVAPGHALTVLSSALAFPVAIATYGGNVYVADYGSNASGAAYGFDEHGALLFRAAEPGTGGVAANAGGVYWATPLELIHADLDGSNQTTLSTDFLNDPITLGPNGVYGTGEGHLPLAVITVGLNGPRGPREEVSSSPSASYGLAADANNVYWTTFSDPMQILSAPLMPIQSWVAPKVLAESAGPGGNIAIDSHSVYWVADGTVMKVPLEGGEATPLASAASSMFLSGIAVDGANVYWSSADRILKVSVDGGTPEVLVTGQDAPASVIVDDTSVYWANVGNPTGNHGSVSRLTPK